MVQRWLKVQEARIYFKRIPDDDTLSELYSDKTVSPVGWDDDDSGKYLKVRIFGNIMPDLFSKYDYIERVDFERLDFKPRASTSVPADVR